MYSQKKIKKKHSGISGKFNISFFIIMQCQGQKNECIGSQAQQHYVKCCHIDKSYCHTEKKVNQFSFSIKL